MKQMYSFLSGNIDEYAGTEVVCSYEYNNDFLIGKFFAHCIITIEIKNLISLTVYVSVKWKTY